MVTARFAGLSDIGHECTAKEHHASAEQPLAYVTFSQEEPGPQDGKESAELGVCGAMEQKSGLSKSGRREKRSRYPCGHLHQELSIYGSSSG